MKIILINKCINNNNHNNQLVNKMNNNPLLFIHPGDNTVEYHQIILDQIYLIRNNLIWKLKNNKKKKKCHHHKQK